MDGRWAGELCRARRPGPDRVKVSDAARRIAGPLFRFDPGWLFLGAGVALLVSTVLIPASEDLALAEARRDRALAMERFYAARLERYADYLQALDAGDEAVLLSLAARELNLAPAGRSVVMAPASHASAGGAGRETIFERLEPAFEPARVEAPRDSLLRRLAVSDATRLWLIAGGALSVLVGLLPAATRRAATAPEVGGGA